MPELGGSWVVCERGQAIRKCEGVPCERHTKYVVHLGSVSSAGALDQLEHICNAGASVEHVTTDQTVFDLPTLDALRARTAEQLATHVAQPTARVTIVTSWHCRRCCRHRCSRSQSMTRSLSRSGRARRDQRHQAAGLEGSWRGRGTPPYERLSSGSFGALQSSTQ